VNVFLANRISGQEGPIINSIKISNKSVVKVIAHFFLVFVLINNFLYQS